jgi:peroxiredoxin
MSRYRLASLLILNSGVALAAVACSEAADPGAGTGGTGMMSGGTGGASASGGTGGTTGGTGGTTGGAGGTTGGSVSSGGMPATGGAGGAMSGSAGTGGSVGGAGGMPPGTGGTPMAGSGSGATGGAAGSGAGAGGTGMTTSCTITPTATESEVIPTVFNVEFTTDFPMGYTARIDFGPTTEYGYSAPVDTAEPMNKTPLLGMKPDTDYHYQIVLSGGGMECKGADQTIKTGLLENGLPAPMVMTPNAAGVAGGFLVGEWYAGKRYAFILDKDNTFVWWFNPADVVSNFGDITRVRMSADGKYMWIGHGNVPSQTGRMVRVKMDGTGGEDMSSKFPRLNHDFVGAPAAGGAGEDIYFVAYPQSGNCDDVVHYSAAGQTTVIFSLNEVFSGACHVNAIAYSPEDDTLVVSELDNNAYVKIKRNGDLVWVLGGGGDNDFTGDGSSWQAQHNLHMLAKDKILFFNNGTGSGSKAVELQLDETAKTATKTWEYSSTIANAIMGDVQRLWNENTLVTFSTQGVIHEVDKNKMLVQSLSWGAGAALGYVVKRETLYGPNPK